MKLPKNILANWPVCLIQNLHVKEIDILNFCVYNQGKKVCFVVI